MDKDKNVYGYTLFISYLQYQNSILQKDFEAAEKYFSKLPEKIHNQAAKFLDTQGHYDLALNITKDEEHQFELCIHLEKLDQAYNILKNFESNIDKWRQLGIFSKII
jgi:coatomer subunit beta'